MFDFTGVGILKSFCSLAKTWEMKHGKIIACFWKSYFKDVSEMPLLCITGLLCFHNVIKSQTYLSICNNLAVLNMWWYVCAFFCLFFVTEKWKTIINSKRWKILMSARVQELRRRGIFCLLNMQLTYKSQGYVAFGQDPRMEDVFL